jgi:hypothetical protein
MLGDINTVITEMALTSEFKSGWDKLEITIGPTQIVTLTWPAWKLKICSFRVPSSVLSNKSNISSSVLNIETLDTLYEKGDSFVWKTGKNWDDQNWDQERKAKVVDVVDAFLEGVWTPPWKCGHCVARAAGKYVPKF